MFDISASKLKSSFLKEKCFHEAITDSRDDIGRYVWLAYKVKTQYVSMCTFCSFQYSQLWDILHILCFYFFIYILHLFLNKQRVLTIIYYNPHQNIFILRNFRRAVDVIVYLVHFAYTVFLLRHENPLSFFFNRLYYLIEHNSN